MSDKKQELVDLISALQVLSATSDLAKKALDDVFDTDVAVPSEDLAPGIISIQEYVSEIGDNKKLINDYLTWLRKAVSDINKAQADISDTIVSDTFSAGSGTPKIVAGGGSSSAGKSHKADALRRQLEETRSKAQLAYRTEDQEALQQYIEDIKELQDELESLDGDVAEMIESFSEQVERAIDSVRSVKSGRSSSGRGGRGSRSTTLLTDAEIQAAVEQYNLTTAGDSRDRTGTIKVKLPSQKNTRSTEKEHIAQLVARIEKSGMFENRDDYSEEGKAIVDELASLITDIKDPKNKSKKSSISQKIRASFQKISNANNTFSTAQVTSIQEDIIKPVMEVLSKAGISDKVLESAAVAKPDDKAIKDAISRVVSMLVTEQSGRYVRVGESVVDNNMMQIMSPDALNRVIRNLGSIVRRSAVKEVIPRGETASLHLLNVLQEAFSDTSAITLASKKDLDTPQDSGALSSTRMHPQYQTSDRANFNAFRRSMRASFNPSLRYGREAQGVDTRAGSQIVASSASAAFGTGFDSIVKKAVDELLTQVRDDISNGNVRSVKVAGNEVELPQALAKMVIEAIQTSAVLSEHTTAMGRMAGDVGPRGAFESGDAVKKVVALFAGDLINQYRTAGGISENAAESFMNETITPAEEKEVALAVTHAQRLRERLTFRRDRASLSMVTASPAGALGYQKEVAQLTKEIELLDEIMRQSDDPEEEKRIAARRGQIALPESTSPVALTRDQALTVIFRAPIGTVPAIPDAVGPTVDKARQVSAGLASAGLTVPVKPTYGTNPVQSVVDFAKTGQDQALERFKTVPIGSQLDETSDATGRMSDKEIIDIISDAFGLSRQSASQGNAITGIYYGGRATDSAGNLLEGDTLDQSLGGGFRTRKGIQSIVQAAAEMSSYGSSGLPIIDYARLATTKDRTAEEQEMFDQVQAKLPHLQTIGSENLEKLAQLDTSMDPQQLIKRVMTLAAPAIQEQIRQLIQRQGASSKMTSSEIDAMMKDFEDTGTAPEGFKAAFHALSMFDPKNINTSDVTAEINRSFSLFSTLLGGQVRPGENIAQFAARILGREDRLKSTSMSSSVSDQQASYGLLARGGEVANEESHAVVGNTYGRNIENQEKLSESLQEFQALTTEIAELRSRSALAPHEADRIAPIIERKIDQLKQLKQKLAAHYAATPDPISQKYETLSTIAQLNDVDPEQRSKAVYELAIMNEIFDQTGRYFIDESQGFGSGSQKERLDALMAHKAKVERLEKLTRAREIISSGGNVEEALKYINSAIASDQPSGVQAQATPVVTSTAAPAAATTTAPSVEDLEAKKTELLKRREAAKAELEALLDTSDAIVETRKEQEEQVQTLEQEVIQLEALVAQKQQERDLTSKSKVEVFIPEYSDSKFYLNKEGTVGVYTGTAPEKFENGYESEDSLAIANNPETGTLTAAVSDGVSQSAPSKVISRLLAKSAVTLPENQGFTLRNILARANATPLEEIESTLRDAYSIPPEMARTMEDVYGLSQKLVEASIQRAKEKAAKEKRTATVKDYYASVSEIQLEAAASDEEFIKYFGPAETYEISAGDRPDYSSRRAALRKPGKSSTNATLSAYRRAYDPDTKTYRHSVVRIGDSPIVSPDLDLHAGHTIIKGNPSQTNTNQHGIIINEKDTNPIVEAYQTTDQPVGIVLASDAFQNNQTVDILTNPAALHKGIVNKHMLQRIEDDPNQFSVKDDRSLIVIGSKTPATSTTLPVGSSSASSTTMETSTATEQLDTIIAEEQRTLDAKKQELEALKAERARQEALQQETDAKIEESNQLLEQIDRTQQQIDAEKTAIAATAAAGSSPTVSTVTPTAAPAAAVVVSDAGRAAAALDVTETSGDSVLAVLDKAIATSTKDVERSQAAIDALKREFGGVDDADGDIKFVVDNTGYDVSYENKQVTDRTSLRPMVRARMTAGSYDDSHYVSSIDVDELVRQADMVTPDVAARVSAMSKDELDNLRMPKPVLDNEIKRFYKAIWDESAGAYTGQSLTDKEYDDYLKERSKQASQRAKDLLENAGPLKDAALEYYKLPVGEARTALTDKNPDLAELVSKIDTELSDELMYQSRREDPWRRAVAAAETKASPEQLAARLLKTSERAVRAYEEELTVDPDFSARDLMLQVVDAATKTRSDGTALDPTTGNAVIDRKLQEFADTGIPEIKGPTDRVRRTRKRRSPSSVVSRVNRTYTADQIAAARRTVRNLGGRSDLTNKQKQKLSVARDRLHNSSVKRLMTDFGDNKGVLQIANVLAGLTPPDWAADPVQSARISAISSAMDALTPAQLAKLKDVDLTDPSHLDRLSADPQLAPIMQMLATQDVKKALNYGAGTTEYERASKLLDAISKARETVSPSTGAPGGDAEEAKRVFFDLETSIANAPERRKILQAAIGNEGESIDQLFAVADPTSPEEIQRIAADTTMSESDRRARIRELALKVSGRPSLVEGKDVSGSVIDSLVEHAMSGGTIYTQAGIRKELQRRIEQSSSVVGHNIAKFDLPTVYGGERSVPSAVVAKTEDTLPMSRSLYPGSHTLGATYEAIFEKPLADAHDAAADTAAVQAIYPILTDESLRKDIQQRYLEKFGIAPDSPIGRLVATPSIASIADPVEQNKAFQDVAAGFSFYQPLADMQEFTRRVTRSGGVTTLRNGDASNPDEQGWYSMSDEEKSKLMGNMQAMFASDITKRYGAGAQLQTLDDAQMGDFVKYVNDTYLQPNMGAAIGGEYGPMAQLLKSKVGNRMGIVDYRKPEVRKDALTGRTLIDFLSGGAGLKLKYNPDTSTATVGGAIGDLSAGKTIATSAVPASKPPAAVTVSSGGSGAPPVDGPRTAMSYDGDDGSSGDGGGGTGGGGGSGFTTIANAAIDTFHADAVEININGGTVKIDANFSAGAAEKMNKSLVYISNKDGMSVEGGAAAAGGGGYRRVSAADRAALNVLESTKNEIAGKLQTETDPAVRERLRKVLENASRRAISQIVEPKTGVMSDKGALLSLAGSATDPKEALLLYNAFAQSKQSELEASLAEAEASPADTAGRSETIDAIKQELQAVQELISALTELNQVEQRIGSANATRPIAEGVETRKTGYPSSVGGYRRLSASDRASLAVLDAVKNSVSEQLRTEQNPEERNRLRGSLTAASNRAIDEIIKPKATQILGKDFVDTVDSISSSPTESLVHYGQATQSTLNALYGELRKAEALPEDAPGREDWINALNQEISAVQQLIDALTELNQAEQRVGSASGTRNVDSPYGSKFDTDSRGNSSRYRKLSTADQASLNLLEATKNEASTRLRFENDPILRESIRADLTNASQKAIDEVIKPKASSALTPAQLSSIAFGPTDPEGSLVAYNEVAQLQYQDLSSQLTAAEAVPEGTAGREDEIERIKREIAAVQELIDALTELNTVEQRVGSASSTRSIDSTYGSSPTAGSSRYKAKFVDDEIAVLQLARNSFDQSGGTMGFGSAQIGRQFLTDLTRTTSAGVIKKTGIDSPAMAAAIGTVAATAPEAKTGFDAALANLDEVESRTGSTISELSDDVFQFANSLQALKNILEPLSATSPEAVAALETVNGAIDAASTAGREARGSAGVLEADNRKKLATVEEQMQAAASRPGIFSAGRRAREQQAILSAYIKDTYGNQGLNMLMQRGRLRGYRKDGKRVDLDMASIEEQRETMQRMRNAGINITDDDMTAMAKNAGRVSQTRRSAPMGDKLFYAASKIRDSQTLIQTVVDTVASIPNIPQMIGGVIQQFASSATGSNRILTTARGLALNPENYAAALTAADQQRKRFGGSLTSNLSQINSFIPLSNAYGVDISKSVKVARKLAAFDPAQGMEGASIAIKEFLSGNVSSLSRRFEINRSALSKINVGDANKMLDSLDEVLSGMGVTDRLIDEQANAMATKYDKMVGNLESVQINLSSGLVDAVTPALESLLGEQSYFGKNIRERTLNSIAKESLTSYGDQALTDPKNGLGTVSLGTDNKTFAYNADKVLERANTRIMAQASIFNAATGSTTSVAPYRLLGNMKPEERYKIQQDAIKYRLDGMDSSQAIMQALRDNSMRSDYNIGAETNLQRTSLNGAYTTRELAKLNPTAYQKAVTDKREELNSLTASLAEDILKSSTERLPQAKATGTGGRGGIGLTRQQVSLTKANIVKQTDIDTYEVLPKGAKEAITVRIPNIDAFERGTSKDLRGRAAAADLLGMDRSMVGKTYVGRSGPEVTLVGKLSNQDKFGRSVVNVITKEGKNLGVSLIAAGEAAVSFTDALTAVQRKKLETVSQLAADLNLGSMNKEASQVGLGGTPAISDEVRSKYFWDKYGMGIKSAPVAGAALGYGAATGYAALSGATLATVSAPLLGFLGAGALAVGGLYAGGAYLADSADNSPEKMRALLKAETENRQQRSKLVEWNAIADLANANAGPDGMLVGGVTPEYTKQEVNRTIAAGMRMSAGTEGLVIPDYQAEAENTQQAVIDQAKLAVGKETYLPALEEESKKVQEKYLSGDEWTKRVLGRKVTNPFTNDEQTYGSFQPVLFAMQKVAESGDPATFNLLSQAEGATNAITDGTANLLEMRKPIEYAEKVGMTVSARDVAEAKAAPLRDQKRRLEATRAEALKYGETGEADNITKEISQITAEIDSITYTDVEWSKVSEEARKIPITLNNISEYTADQLAFINDYVSKTAANPTDFKREAKEFSSGAMERTAQRRQQRVDTALTSFARQAIMGLGMMSEVDPRSGIITTTDNTAEARAVRMVQRSSLMPANRNSGQDIIKELTDAQIAAVNEQKDIARNNRQTALMAAPEAQLLKSGFTNFAMWMNMVGATAQDLGRSFRTTMDIMSEGNPRFALDFAQQTTGLSYGTMMQMQLIPNRVDATGNPVSSFNGANGQPYSGTGPMFMPYTTGPRGFIKYANDAMRPNASGVREGALGIAPSDWMQLVNNATASNQQLQRTALSNGIQMRDLNKNHQRTLEDITRSGMRQLESIHLNYTRQMYQLTLQAELVKRTTRANAARSIAMADIDPTRKNGIAQQYWAMDMYAQHLGQGDAKGFLKDTATIDVLKQIDPTLAENIAGLETANAAYENTAITDPNRQNLQDAKRAQIEPLLAKLRDLYGKEKDPIRKAAIQAAIARLSPNAQKTVDAQNANAQWLQSELGDAVQEKQFGQQIDDMNFQNSYRSLDRANSAQSVRDAAESGDPLQLANAQRSNASMERGFVQADATLAGLSNSLSGLTGTAYLFDDATTQTFKNIEETGGSAVDGVLNSVEDFKTSFNQQMEDALRNFNNQRLDMIQSFADAAVEIASIVPEEMVPIMQAASQFMNVQRQADLLWLAGRTDEANDLVYKGMLALGDVVYGEGKGKEYADKYQQNYTDMGEIAARDVPQGEWGKFGVNTTAGWALRVKVTEAPNKQVNRTHRDNNKNTHGGFEQDPAAYEPVWP